ncbi:hypothetical protein MRB53_042262 [Persea americana]|nr:hypothetical protein MRB53_042262 [Persea americana]
MAILEVLETRIASLSITDYQSASRLMASEHRRADDRDPQRNECIPSVEISDQDGWQMNREAGWSRISHISQLVTLSDFNNTIHRSTSSFDRQQIRYCSGRRVLHEDDSPLWPTPDSDAEIVPG